jgi:hypothetical protein
MIRIILLYRKHFTDECQPCEESVCSVEKSHLISSSVIDDDEFEEEEIISGGFVPASQSTRQISIHIEEEILEEEILEEEIVLSSVSVAHRFSKQDNASPAQSAGKAKSVAVSPLLSLERIAQKSNLLKKHEDNFIPNLPTAIIPTKMEMVSQIDYNDEDDESPIDDLTLDRLSKVKKIVEQNRKNAMLCPTPILDSGQTIPKAGPNNNENLQSANEDIIVDRKRMMDEHPKPTKKGKWLDMILN